MAPRGSLRGTCHPPAKGWPSPSPKAMTRMRCRRASFGLYNVANLLGVIAALRTLGVPLAAAVRACARLAPVPGRMEQIVLPGQPLVAVSPAHADAAPGAGRAALWHKSAAGGCGACSATAATATRASAADGRGRAAWRGPGDRDQR